MAELSENAHYASQLGTFLKEIQRCMEKVRLEVPGLELFTIKAPEQIQNMIPELLKFPVMSFLELHYRFSGLRAKPGIRFLLEDSKSGRQVRMILFQDTVFWNVDSNLAKIEEELVTFQLEVEEIQANPSQLIVKRSGPARGWRTWLYHALLYALPSDRDSGREQQS